MTDRHSSTPFPPLLARARLEPWGVGYLGSVQDAGMGELEEDETVSGELLERAALEVETPLADWRPLAPGAPMEVERILFLDGVRRIEARLLVEGEALVFGALGSCAVAAVTSRPGSGYIDYEGEPTLQRWCAVGGGLAEGSALTVEAYGGAQRLEYVVASSPENDKDTPVRVLHGKMQAAERLLASRLLPELGDGLLLCDGTRPLHGGDRRVLGYIKTVQAQRLPQEALNVVRALQEGERSPLYLVGEGQGASFEWYVRLRDPGPWAHTLAGSVRLQAYAGPEPRAQLAWAREVADWSCAVLPRFATRTHQDPRAPQQLLPVRALEETLRRRLGSAPLLRRRMVAALAQGSDL